LKRLGVNEYGDPGRVKKRFHKHGECQNAFINYFCWINFPRWWNYFFSFSFFFQFFHFFLFFLFFFLFFQWPSRRFNSSNLSKCLWELFYFLWVSSRFMEMRKIKMVQWLFPWGDWFVWTKFKYILHNIQWYYISSCNFYTFFILFRTIFYRFLCFIPC
jgi:hypothetical protein